YRVGFLLVSYNDDGEMFKCKPPAVEGNGSVTLDGTRLSPGSSADAVLGIRFVPVDAEGANLLPCSAPPGCTRGARGFGMQTATTCPDPRKIKEGTYVGIIEPIPGYKLVLALVVEKFSAKEYSVTGKIGFPSSTKKQYKIAGSYRIKKNELRGRIKLPKLS